MFQYYIKLAWISVRSTPVLTALMVLAIGVGVASCITVFTLFTLLSHNPLEHKNDSVFAIQLDSWGKDEAYNFINEVPPLLPFKDAVALYQSKPIENLLLMMKAGITVSPQDAIRDKTTEISRVTTNEFFNMFDVPFIYGKSWTDEDDRNAEEYVVITEGLNERFFAGENSVGKILLVDKTPFTIVGVVADSWRLFPGVFDLNNTAFEEAPQVYIPFFNLSKRGYQNWGNTQSWDTEDNPRGWEEFLASGLTWVQMWAELEGEDEKQVFRSYLEAFVSQEKNNGRYERPLKVLINSPEEWLKIAEVVDSDAYILLLMAFSFLLVCLVNSIVLLMAKFYRKAPEAGVRRALGASQRAIFIQHLAEAFVVALIGGAVGILLSIAGIAGIGYLYSYFKDVASLNLVSLGMALLLVVVSTLVSGVLPAYKISRTEPARYLKTQ
ncbi:MAG: ABC transporter ATP-binding protein [Alteromonadaceae bacterium]|nr:MAG: ABC transporter ATP-binding protein [Alteromonadaceae bacterium]